MKNSIVDNLEKIVGKDNLYYKKKDLVPYAYDATTKMYMPDIVVFPGNTLEVSAIMKIANENLVPLTPRGAGTGMTGGALARNGGILMVMKRMNRILLIDPKNMIAITEPGVITGKFQEELEKRNLFYPPDPSSSAYSTMGGNAAECAGGPRAVKYGVTRDYILGLKAVLASGEIIKTGVRTAKGVVGYDLTRLIIGSEGTLAVITEITVKIIPLPKASSTLTAVFKNMEDAARTVSAVFEAQVPVRSIEYLDNASLICAENYLKTGLPVDAGAVLIFSVDGEESHLPELIQRLTTVCEKCNAREVVGVDDPERAEAMWKARKLLSPALYTYAPHKINEDIVVPRSKIPAMVRKIDQLREETGLTMVSFGHAGDGNIHFNVMLDKNDKEAHKKALYAVETVFDYTLELGGTLSGEHGVGLTKAPYMEKEIKPAELNLMRGIKKVFDPNGILNPGKMRIS